MVTCFRRRLPPAKSDLEIGFVGFKVSPQIFWHSAEVSANAPQTIDFAA
jgi:hypothetical protein